MKRSPSTDRASCRPTGTVRPPIIAASCGHWPRTAGRSRSTNPTSWDRQANRDIDPPDWCRVDVWEATPEGCARPPQVPKRRGSSWWRRGIGYEDDALRRAVLEQARPDALRICWDVDAPATLATLRAEPDHPLRRDLPEFDLVLTYGGGQPVVDGYRALGARDCVPIYNALDPDDAFPGRRPIRASPPISAFSATACPTARRAWRSSSSSPRARLPDRRFLLGGVGWERPPLPDNVRAHRPCRHRRPQRLQRHARARCSTSPATAWRQNGFSPATRVFEAAGAGACLITDAWEGIELFLEPGREVLVARDGAEVVEHPERTDRGRGAEHRPRRAPARAGRPYLREPRASRSTALFAAACRNGSFEP